MMTRWLSRLAAASVLLTLAGCATPGLFKLSKDEFPKTGPKNPVIRILGLWNPAEGMAANKTSRGFSGQVLFFSRSSDLPAQVDGEVRIYVYDDQGSPDDQVKPIHQFDFPADSWKALLAKGALGATYGVFVPYSRTGNHEAKCSLRIRYTPPGGLPVFSDSVNIVLPGVKKAKVEDIPAEGDGATTGPDTRDGSAAVPQPGVTGRTPPRARGISTAIPTPQEIQEQLQAQKKLPAAELNSKERRRIMRAATARLESGEDASHVSLAGNEEPETEAVAADEASSGLRLRKPQTDAEDSLDANGDDETPASVKTPAKSAKRHILDDEE